MSNTAKLLDKARELCVPATDYRLAKTLGVSAGRMSNWRRGKFPDNEAAFKLADLLGIPATEVIAYIEADRAKTDQQRSFWSAHLSRALPSIAIASAGLLALGGSLIGGKAEATAAKTNFASNVYYVK